MVALRSHCCSANRTHEHHIVCTHMYIQIEYIECSGTYNRKKEINQHTTPSQTRQWWPRSVCIHSHRKTSMQMPEGEQCVVVSQNPEILQAAVSQHPKCRCDGCVHPQRNGAHSVRRSTREKKTLRILWCRLREYWHCCVRPRSHHRGWPWMWILERDIHELDSWVMR